jgi:hypothetical protein
VITVWAPDGQRPIRATIPGVRGLQAKFTVPEELLAPEQIESGALPAGSAGRRYSRCAAQ